MDKQLGLEATVGEYVAKMVEVFRLVREALAPWGTVWLNVGDTYAGGGGGNYGNGKSVKSQGGQQITNVLNRGGFGIAPGNLCLIPWRLAIALQDDGWIVRSVVVWHKPSPMPASLAGWRWARCRVKVKDRDLAEMPAKWVNGKRHEGEPDRHREPVWRDCPGCKRCEPHGGYVLRRGSWRATSSWEPVLMLAKGPGYFSDGESVKTPPAAATVSRDQYTRVLDDPDEQFAVRHDHETLCESGANARDVQTWAAEPLKERHYAAFPTALVNFCLRAGTSAKGYCPSCGMPWARVVERVGGPPPGDHRQREDFHETDYNAGAHPEGVLTGGSLSAVYRKYGMPETTTLGWKPTCGCIGADCLTPRAGLVLDPFSGSQRVGLQAARLGLDYLGIELSEEYCRMGERILQEQGMSLFNDVTVSHPDVR